MRLLFFGSPAVAVPFLEACAQDHEVAAVVTQPDRPAGRKLLPAPPPVKIAAQRLGLAVLQPKSPSAIAGELRAVGADAAVVVAYGRMLKPAVLSSARHGFMNVHFSVLPKYRGAAPVQWSLINGEAESGVTLFWIDEGMDTGAVQRAARTPIGPDEDALELFDRLVRLGVAQLRAALSEIASGRVRREPQSGVPSEAPKVSAETARIRFGMSASEFHNRVRGLRAGPKAHILLRFPGRDAPVRVSLLKTSATGIPAERSGGTPGEVLVVDREKGFLVQCNPGSLWVREVQPEGKKPQFAVDFLNGLRAGAGTVLICL